ncbi:MAG: hypothetical protein CMH54_01180 [Myxococcales bacterium]|nr:hypothetical protein [Myxococcales bacterium]
MKTRSVFSVLSSKRSITARLYSRSLSWHMIVLFALFAGQAGCAGGCDGTTPLIDVPDISDSDSSDTIGTTAFVDFAIATASGETGFGESNVILTAEDEPEKYKDVADFQVDIVVETRNVENGQPVQLYVKDQLVDETQVQLDAGADEGSALFEAVTLGHDTEGYEIRVETINQDGETAVEAKTAQVSTGFCSVDVLPPNTGCLTEDIDEAGGLQVQLTVLNAEADCDQASLTVSIDGADAETFESSLDASGQAVFVLTVSSEDTVDGLGIEVSAQVSDSQDPSRTGATNPLDYVIDTVAPTVLITVPDKSILTLGDDLDGDPSNGLNTFIEGTVSGESTGEVQLNLDSTELGLVAAQGDGTFRLDTVFQEAGTFTLSAVVTDSCGNEGTDSRILDIIPSPSDLTIMTPTNNSTLLAVDDNDPQTSLFYETQFDVMTGDIPLGYDLSIECADSTTPDVYVEVGSTLLDVADPDDRYLVDVVLNRESLGVTQNCHARYQTPTPSISGDVQLTVALPAPTLTILEPATNFSTNQGVLAITASATGLDDIVPVATILGGDGEPISDTTVVESSFQNGGLTTQLALETTNGIALPDGPYTLQLDADDTYGNAARDNPASVYSVEFRIDKTPPSLSLIAPAVPVLDPENDPNAADVDPDLAGYQTTIEIQVTGESLLEQVQVCIQINSGVETCTTPAPDNGVATFTAVTLQPGTNTLTWSATDASGNLGQADPLVLTLVLNAPKVFILSPTSGTVTIGATTDVLVRVEDSETGGPITLATVTVENNGVFQGGSATDQGNGTYLLPGFALSPDNNVLIAHADADGYQETGVSEPITVIQKSTEPTISFLYPYEGAVIIGTTAACQPGPSGCTLRVELSSEELETGSPATLTVCCDQATPCDSNNAVVYNSTQAVDGLYFDDVVLTDQSTCELSATATDLAGQTASTDPLAVSVDRLAPVLQEFVQPSEPALTFTNDEDPAPGLQTHLSVRVSGVESGQVISITAIQDNLPVAGFTIPVTNTVPDSSNQVFSSDLVTLPEGILTLRADVADALGNSASPLNTIVEVLSDQPAVQITQPAYVQNVSCTQDSECSSIGAICEGGSCATPWNAASGKTLTVLLQGIPTGTALRICSNNGPPGASQCNTLGYKIVTEATTSGPAQALSIETLSDGLHDLIAEALPPGIPPVSSLDAPIPDGRSRHIYVDTVSPDVVGLLSLSDTEIPIDILNYNELQAAGGQYQIQVQSSEANGWATVYADGLQAGSGAISGFQYETGVTLNEGPAQVYAIITDRAGNPSPSPPASEVVYYAPTVDTIPPSLVFDTPSQSPLNNTSAPGQFDISLSTSADVIGSVVTLWDNGSTINSAVVTDQATAVFPASDGILSEGTHVLTAEVSDTAGNTQSASTSPATIVVDTTPPSVTLAAPSPSSPTTFGDASNPDSQPSVGGFQVLVQFQSSADAATWEITLANDCALTYAGCGSPYVVASGTIQNPGGQEADTHITVPFTSTPYHVVRARVFDANGNVAEDRADFEVVVNECSAGLSGLPVGGTVNNANCATPGEDCAQASMEVRVVFVGPCAGIATAQLQKDGSDILSPQPVILDEAVFTVPFDDGDSFLLSGIGLDLTETELANTGGTAISVDLSDPVISFVSQDVGGFTTAASGGTVLVGLADDQAPLSADVQIPVAIDIDDASGSATINSIKIDGTDSVPALLSPSLPHSIAALPSNEVVYGVTLSHGDGQAVVVEVADDAGNTATATFTANVDTIAPDAPTVSIDSIDRRMPLIDLSWTATADDGNTGDSVSSYDVRYSKNPITAGNFDSACSADLLPGTTFDPVPAAPGDTSSYTIAGPDPRNPTTEANCHFITSTTAQDWYIAVRALDDVGNASDLATSAMVSTDELVYHVGRISHTGGNGFFHYTAYDLGDLDGDGLGDVAMGGFNVHEFCVIYGRTFSTGTATISVTDGGDDDAQCFAGAAGSHHGKTVVNLGDINEDGYNDISAGSSGASGSPAAELFIYFGQADGTLEASASVSFTGILQNNTSGVTSVSHADFNGDGIQDIVVGSFSENRVYVIPGDSNWPPASAESYDLQDSATKTALGVITIEIPDAGAPAEFGRRVAGVGNLLTDEGPTQYEDIAAITNRDPPQVIVIQGRASATTIQLSSLGGSTADDNTVVRLRSQSGSNNFGTSALQGGRNVIGDETPDIVVGHAKGVPTYSVAIFDGSTLDGKFDTNVYVDPIDPSPVGDDVYRGTNGTIVGGDILEPVFIPPLDDVNGSPSTWDLAYRKYNPNNTFQSGQVYARLNVSDAAAGWDIGDFPWQSVVIDDPDDPGYSFFGLSGVIGVPDFNDDNFPDIIVPVYSAAGMVIMY